MLNNNISELNTTLPYIKFGDDVDSIFTFLEKAQLKRKNLWKTLVEQFITQPDSKDGGWRGEFWGKLMRGASVVYSYTKDAKLYDILHQTVDDLLATQDEYGRISSYKKEKEFFCWDMWSRKYVMLGLEFYYDICDDNDQKQRIISALIKHADYIIDNVNENKIPVNRTSSIWGCINSYSILQPMVKLYKLTGDDKYKKYAIHLIKDQDAEGMNLFERAYQDQIAPYQYSVTKAYEMMSCFEGLLEFYEISGEQKCLDAVTKFVDAILRTDYTIVGGTGCRHELLDNSTVRQVIHDPIEMQETCVTVTLMKLLTNLYKHTKHSAYFDAIERSFYNIYVGAINKDHYVNHQPVVLSYSPILHNARGKEVGGKKKITKSTFYGCCISIASVGLIALTNLSAFYNNGELTLNFFGDATYSFDTDKGEIEFTVSGDYPKANTVSINFTKVPSGLKLKLRKPDWCKDYKLSCLGCLSDGYIVIDKEINAGDTIAYTFDMPYQLVSSLTVNPNVDYRTALVKGPIVYACDNYPTDDVLDFDFDNISVTEIDDKKFALALKEGKQIIMKKYCDSGKDDFLRQCVNIWLRCK